jgi:hypothetical protein
MFPERHVKLFKNGRNHARWREAPALSARCGAARLLLARAAGDGSCFVDLVRLGRLVVIVRTLGHHLRDGIEKRLEPL